MDEGLFAQYADADALRRALAELRAHRHRRIDAFIPYPDEAIERLVAPRRGALTLLAGAAALFGIVAGYGLQWWLTARLYPLDVGGRPPHAPLSFVPITFETAVLAAAIVAFATVLIGAGMPRLWRPAFDLAGFERVSTDGFWAFVSADDPVFDPVRTRELLERSGALRVIDCPQEAS